jgi:ribosomal protein S25
LDFDRQFLLVLTKEKSKMTTRSVKIGDLVVTISVEKQEASSTVRKINNVPPCVIAKKRLRKENVNKIKEALTYRYATAKMISKRVNIGVPTVRAVLKKLVNKGKILQSTKAATGHPTGGGHFAYTFKLPR